MLHGDKIKELDALVSLIDEPNEEMYFEIRHKVISYGNQAIPVLEEAWVNTLGDNDSDRIEDLIENIRRNDLRGQIDSWRSNTQNKLWDGYSILMQYVNPSIDLNTCNSIFEKINKEIWLEINENLTALEKIKVVNHVLFSVNEFGSSDITNLPSDSFHLNKLMENRIANPFTLGVLYLAIAQNLNIPVYGVDLPGHFIASYIDEKGPLKTASQYKEGDVMFYINPANNGAVFTHNEIRHYINKMELELKPNYLLPTTNTNILNRIIREMIVVYESENNQIKKEGLSEILMDI